MLWGGRVCSVSWWLAYRKSWREGKAAINVIVLGFLSVGAGIAATQIHML